MLAAAQVLAAVPAAGDDTGRLMVMLITALVGIAAALAALTVWYWRYTNPRKRPGPPPSRPERRPTEEPRSSSPAQRRALGGPDSSDLWDNVVRPPASARPTSPPSSLSPPSSTSGSLSPTDLRPHPSPFHDAAPATAEIPATAPPSTTAVGPSDHDEPRRSEGTAALVDAESWLEAAEQLTHDDADQPEEPVDADQAEQPVDADQPAGDGGNGDEGFAGFSRDEWTSVLAMVMDGATKGDAGSDQPEAGSEMSEVESGR